MPGQKLATTKDGDYASAVSNLGSDASFNKALAELLNGSASSVAGIVDGSADAETGQGYYLKAVAAARQDDLQGILNNLKSAIAKDGSYKTKTGNFINTLKMLRSLH